MRLIEYVIWKRGNNLERERGVEDDFKGCASFETTMKWGIRTCPNTLDGPPTNRRTRGPARVRLC
jgi:hypothetical protein